MLLELGLAESLTLDREPAIEHLRRGVETTKDTVARLYAARTLAAMVGMNDPSQAVEIVERALAASPDADPALALHIEAHMVSMARFALSSRRATFDRAARLRERVEAGELDGAMELTVAATEVTMAGESAERAAALAERAIEALRADPILAVVVGFAVALPDRRRPPRRSRPGPLGDGRRRPPAAGQLPRGAGARCSAPTSASAPARSAMPWPTPRPRSRPTRTPAG